MTIYLIGSLRNARVPLMASLLRDQGHDVFDDWYAAGPEADDKWRDYEQGKGNDLVAALDGYAAKHVYEFDLSHLKRCDAGILLLPSGRSGHLELGFMAGLGKKTYILLDGEPDRYDVMYRFATQCCRTTEELLDVVG